ncbi:HAD superfamily hydrolase (TIGR01459 family) [Palleronia aestuarii]|uniref:HAD superfamily hydrolase (TIGR01459 family) n=1 Tax=Palleronia aestuarii TaxID=568105 RepID=A0A2W7NQM0_9RHOB|nr:HAD-IIA family hydrolase [Palleronia aestuarii]PZX13602.1 HAD superfamily hydrolase (TIGR01459 family) [Palleronia aestuarii]
MSVPTVADPARAFETYLRVRPRLPEASFPATWQAVESLEDIADAFDLILLDAYGVLNVGERPIPGAADRIASLRSMGKRVMVVSNSAGYPKRRMMERYTELGFDFSPSEVVTSREALLAHLAASSPRRWGVMMNLATPDEELADLDIDHMDEDRAAYDDAVGFLLIGSEGWTDTRQALLESSLRANPRPILVGNPDLVAPREIGLTREPGYFAHRLIDRTGLKPRFFGKPFPEIFDLAVARQSVAHTRVLMVGDTLHTDILGGRHMGFATALVTGHGSLAELDAGEAIEQSGIVPDFVLNQI